MKIDKRKVPDWIWDEEDARARETEEPVARRTLSSTLKTILYNEQQNWFLWTPVAFAIGCATYFSLLEEPSWPAVLIFLVGAALACSMIQKHSLASISSIFVLLVAMGFTFSKQIQNSFPPRF